MYFFKNILLYSGAWFRQSKCIAMINKKESTKIVNVMTPSAGVLMLDRGIDQTNQIYSNDDQGRVYLNCKFHDPRGRGSCAWGVAIQVI